MANETTVPTLPCRSIDANLAFYGAIGFTATYRQARPNGYAVVRLEDIELHFFAMPDLAPADSYSSCIVVTDDVAALHRSFVGAMRERYGKILSAGIPRMTRPRLKRDRMQGFNIVDPAGNWIRFIQRPTATMVPEPGAGIGDADGLYAIDTGSPLARALDNAGIFGDSKGDPEAAARLLDAALAKSTDADVTDRVRALVYRAELALVLGDHEGARDSITRARAIPLTPSQCVALGADLEHATDLEGQLA